MAFRSGTVVEEATLPRVAIVNESFCKQMGYLPNLLCRYLARFGVETHLIVGAFPPYHYRPDFDATFDSFGEQLVPGTVESYDGYTLHVLAQRRVLGYARHVGLRARLKELRPDVVQTFVSIGWPAFDCALARPWVGYKLFIGNHNAASTFPLARRKAPFGDPEMLRCRLLRSLPGRLVSLGTEKCYAATEDCAEIAWRFYGVQRRKVEVTHLGVDTDVFFPATPSSQAERRELRRRLGLADHEIVCINTGKLTQEKNPLLVAQAAERLRALGRPYRSLFIGNGPERHKLSAISSAVTLDFMRWDQLAPYYRAADIGVWPTIESTSILDAAACGLPLVVSDQIYRAPVEGNGTTYRLNDLDSMVEALLRLEPLEVRAALGASGAAKMKSQFSMEQVTSRRLRDYLAALGREPAGSGEYFYPQLPQSGERQ